MKKILLIFLISCLSSKIASSQSYDNNILTFTYTKETDIVYDYPISPSGKAVEFYNNAVKIAEYNSDTAIEYYLKAIEIDPIFVQAYDNLGQLFRILKKYNEAIKCYQKSIEIYPYGHLAHINIAAIYKLQNKSKDAIHHFKKVISIKPESPEGYYGISGIYFEQNELNLALEYGWKALEIYKKKPTIGIADGYAQIGVIYYYSGNYTEAKRNIQLAKSKYIEYDIEDIFHSTFPDSFLKELSIN